MTQINIPTPKKAVIIDSLPSPRSEQLLGSLCAKLWAISSIILYWPSQTLGMVVMMGGGQEKYYGWGGTGQ